MAKIDPKNVADAAEYPVTIEEFCARASLTDRRVELLGAFAAAERSAGRFKDMESSFAARMKTFAAQPA